MTDFAENNNEKITVYVYEWQAWGSFLFQSLYNNAERIEAKIRQSNSGILNKVVAEKGYFLFHLNLTKTKYFFQDKQELLTLLKNKNIISLNAEINDTSKKYLQNICKKIGLNVTRASVEGDGDEMLIIKTNFNYGGKPEKALSNSEFRLLKLSSDNYNAEIIYPVMQRKKIKKKVWNNENLIVEKYITNKYNHVYRAYKLLNKVVISEVVNNDLIKKMSLNLKRINHYYNLNNYDHLPGDEVKYYELLNDIKLLSLTLQLDYGAIDVVKSDENKYYIIDVNTTPAWGREDAGNLLSFLSEGILNN